MLQEISRRIRETIMKKTTASVVTGTKGAAVVFVDEPQHDPYKNPDAISLIKQTDGNWKGWMNRFGKVVEVRDVGPEIVLKLLLTHDGN